MQQDELANLFSRNLTFSHSSNCRPEENNFEEPPTQPQPITYISQHYHHSAHITHRTSKNDIEEILSRNDIDPSILSPPQIELFKNADSDQRNRLVELWRISPPDNQTKEFFQINGIWRDTTLAEEEEMAQARYQKLALGDSMDTINESAAVQAVTGFMANRTSPDLGRDAEPYVLSGYEMLARKEYENQELSLRESTKYNQATDPIFKGIPGLWEKPTAQDMENQYGTFEQMRDYGLWQAPVDQAVEVFNVDEDMVL